MRTNIKAVKNTDGVTSVMPSYFCDVQTDADSGGRTMRVIALPEKYGDNSVQNKLVLTEGRLPEKSGEIAADSSSFTAEGYKIGDKIRFAKQTGDTDTSTELKTLEYTVVGLVQSPLYIAYQRGLRRSATEKSRIISTFAPKILPLNATRSFM